MYSLRWIEPNEHLNLIRKILTYPNDAYFYGMTYGFQIGDFANTLNWDSFWRNNEFKWLSIKNHLNKLLRLISHIESNESSLLTLIKSVSSDHLNFWLLGPNFPIPKTHQRDIDPLKSNESISWASKLDVGTFFKKFLEIRSLKFFNG